MTGRLYGVGVGPGDPELITLKAAQLIKSADVIAYHSGTAGRSIARTIADSLISEHVIEELLIYPVTTGPTDHPLGYYGAVDDFYDESAERLSKHLDAGRTVVVLAEGDPLFYSSYMYLHDRLSPRFPSEIVPGVTSLTAAATALRTPLARHEDILTVLPGTLPVPELARRLADTDAAAIMKLGRTFAGVREALRQAGRLADALYVERATTGEQRVMPVSEVDAEHRAVLFHDRCARVGIDASIRQVDRRRCTRHSALIMSPRPGSMLSVLGPGPTAGRPRRSRRCSPRLIMSWATAHISTGLRPDQVSSGTLPATPSSWNAPGTLLILRWPANGLRWSPAEMQESSAWPQRSSRQRRTTVTPQVKITVLPGVTAAQAVAARAGAPLGGDYAVVSLSDRLKPWSVIERAVARCR